MTGLVDEGKEVDVVYSEFSWAFDTVSYKIPQFLNSMRRQKGLSFASPIYTGWVLPFT